MQLKSLFSSDGSIYSAVCTLKAGVIAFYLANMSRPMIKTRKLREYLYSTQ